MLTFSSKTEATNLRSQGGQVNVAPGKEVDTRKSFLVLSKSNSKEKHSYYKWTTDKALNKFLRLEQMINSVLSTAGVLLWPHANFSRLSTGV